MKNLQESFISRSFSEFSPILRFILFLAHLRVRLLSLALPLCHLLCISDSYLSGNFLSVFDFFLDIIEYSYF